LFIRILSYSILNFQNETNIDGLIDDLDKLTDSLGTLFLLFARIVVCFVIGFFFFFVVLYCIAGFNSYFIILSSLFSHGVAKKNAETERLDIDFLSSLSLIEEQIEDLRALLAEPITPTKSTQIKCQYVRFVFVWFGYYGFVLVFFVEISFVAVVVVSFCLAMYWAFLVFPLFLFRLSVISYFLLLLSSSLTDLFF
jgi:hypothetical protein